MDKEIFKKKYTTKPKLKQIFNILYKEIRIYIRTKRYGRQSKIS